MNIFPHINKIYENSILDINGLENIPINIKFYNSLTNNMSFIEYKQNNLLYKFLYHKQLMKKIKYKWDRNIYLIDVKSFFNNSFTNIYINDIIKNKR